MVFCCLCLFLLPFGILAAIVLILRKLMIEKRLEEHRKTGRYVIGFFHPYCNAGGGGERVLWCAIRAIQQRFPAAKCLIYTGDSDANPEKILARAKSRFNVEISDADVEFVYLKWRRLVEADLYPVFTLLGQSIGGALLGFEALFRRVPFIFFDTMGYAFTMPIFRYLAGCPVVCYVHYCKKFKNKR